MGDWPEPAAATPTHISSMMTNYFPTAEMRGVANGPPNNTSSGAWPAANQALYIPFSLPHPYVARMLYWANGSAAAGEWNAAIYTSGFELLGSTGATGGSGNSAIQYASLTDLPLNPGSYIFALLHNATTANRANHLAITAIQGRIGGLTQQAVGSTTLPDSATPAAFTATIYPLCGLTRTSTGF